MGDSDRCSTFDGTESIYADLILGSQSIEKYQIADIFDLYNKSTKGLY